MPDFIDRFGQVGSDGVPQPRPTADQLHTRDRPICRPKNKHCVVLSQPDQVGNNSLTLTMSVLCSVLNNPSGTAVFKQKTMAPSAWEAGSGEPNDFVDAFTGWFLECEDICNELNNSSAGCSPEDFLARIENARPVPNLFNRPKLSSRLGGGAHVPKLEYIIKERLSHAFQTVGSNHPPRSNTDPSVAELAATFFKQAVVDDVKEDGTPVNVTLNGYLGDKVDRRTAGIFNQSQLKFGRKESFSPVSIDHVDPVTLVRNAHHQIVTDFLTPSNLLLTSSHANFGKHGYVATIWALKNAILYLVCNVPVLMLHDPQRARVARLLKLIVLDWDVWPEPTNHLKRLLLPADLIIKAQRFRDALMSLIGLEFATSLSQLNFDEADADVQAQSKPRWDEMRARAAQQSFSSSVNTAPSLLRHGLTRVRNPDYESFDVNPKVSKLVEHVRRQWIAKGLVLLGERRFKFALNSAGIPALSISGDETLVDMTCALVACLRHLCSVGSKVEPHVVYALITAWNVFHALQSVTIGWGVGSWVKCACVGQDRATDWGCQAHLGWGGPA